MPTFISSNIWADKDVQSMPISDDVVNMTNHTYVWVMCQHYAPDSKVEESEAGKYFWAASIHDIEIAGDSEETAYRAFFDVCYSGYEILEDTRKPFREAFTKDENLYARRLKIRWPDKTVKWFLLAPLYVRTTNSPSKG